MALLHYMLSVKEKFHVTVIALNVEHGIRGKSSLSDTEFCKNYCQKLGVSLLCYSVDAIKTAKEKKLSVEQAARLLRYECFFDAINSNKCDKIATAHHLSDNFESVLFNLFRGTGMSGASGITKNYQNKIIRPFLSVSREEIDEYIAAYSIPFVTDQTNFSTDYTRNALRLKVIPQIKEIFPKAEKSMERFTEILSLENDYLDEVSKKALSFNNSRAEIAIPVHPAIFNRAAVLALKSLGIEKDYEKTHIDGAYSLIKKDNGSIINLPQDVCAAREYDKIVFYKNQAENFSKLPFSVGKHEFADKPLSIIELTAPPENLKNGFYGDGDKIPKTAVIRTKKEGDIFTKFGGGTKSLGDYLTDLKIPKRERENLPVLADGNTVLLIFGVALSDKIKVDKSTKKVLQFLY